MISTELQERPAIATITVGYQEMTLEMVSIVQEFVDVFPGDLPSLPPEREVKFGIDVVLGTTPISNVPYQITPIQLKELREQI